MNEVYPAISASDGSPMPADVWQKRSGFLRAYAEAARGIEDIRFVFYDDAPGDLRVVVVYSGDRWVLRPKVYDIQEELYRTYGPLRVDTDFVPLSKADIASLRRTFRQTLPA